MTASPQNQYALFPGPGAVTSKIPGTPELTNKDCAATAAMQTHCVCQLKAGCAMKVSPKSAMLRTYHTLRWSTLQRNQALAHCSTLQHLQLGNSHAKTVATW